MDWTGNRHSVEGCLGVFGKEEREQHDYYATTPKAAEWLIKLESLNKNIWECACGEGHLGKIFKSNGFNVKKTDLIDRGYGEGGVDFLQQTEMFDGDIVTNPPYKYAQEFVEHALELVKMAIRFVCSSRCNFLKVRQEENYLTNTLQKQCG